MNKEIIKDLLPPIAIRILKQSGVFGLGPHWKGDYPSWQAALEDSIGYDADDIVEKVKESTLKVTRGEAAYERDSVLFNEIQYSWPVLSGLLWVYAHDGHLSVIDFGGSLGSTFYQNRKFLQSLEKVKWNIVEQKRFVDIGLDLIQTERLKFYYTIESCMEENKPNCILLSSVLPYVPDPYGTLAEIFTHRFPFLILDKMPFLKGPKDRITIQKTPKSIYQASYPAWFFSESKFRSVLEKQYTIVEEFRCKDEANIKSVYKGMILKLK